MKLDANTINFERLKVIVNSINGIKDSPVIQIEKDICLNGETIKKALDELFGDIAHVILDEYGKIFSSSILEESNSSLNCLKKLQKIVSNEDDNKSIIIITGERESTKIVLILTKPYQSISNSKEYAIVYSIDPFTGKRDLVEKTKLFKRYLKEGNIENGLNPLFNNKINLAENLNDVAKACNKKDVGWWCIFYCLMLIYNGNDEFLNENDWASIDIKMIKLVLTTHIDSLNEEEKNFKIQDEKKIDLKS